MSAQQHPSVRQQVCSSYYYYLISIREEAGPLAGRCVGGAPSAARAFSPPSIRLPRPASVTLISSAGRGRRRRGRALPAPPPSAAAAPPFITSRFCRRRRRRRRHAGGGGGRNARC